MKILSQLLTVLLLCSCGVAPLPKMPVVDPGATLHLYLQPLPQEVQQLTMTITTLNARRSDGQEFPLLTEALRLDPAEKIGRQTKLLVSQLPVGEYLGLSLGISEATLATEDGVANLLVESGLKLIEAKFLIKPTRAQTLFLALQPERLITDGYHLTAQFSLRKPLSVLPTLKGVISHPDTGTLTFIEKNTPTVVSVLAVGQGPAGLVLDQNALQAYLALAGENSLVVVDLTTEQVLRKLQLRPSDRPRNLALSTDGLSLIVTNPGTNSASIIDVNSFNERGRTIFSSKPARVFSNSSGTQAYVILPETNGLALVDLNRAIIVQSVRLEEAPTRGVADSDGQQIYLLTEDSPNLLVLNAQTLSVENRIFIGYGARCLAFSNELVYVGLQNGQIAVVDPLVDLPIDSFQVGGAVVDIVPDLGESSLFVLTEDDQRLSKYNLISRKRLATLEMNTASYEMAVMGEN